VSGGEGHRDAIIFSGKDQNRGERALIEVRGERRKTEIRKKPTTGMRKEEKEI